MGRQGLAFKPDGVFTTEQLLELNVTKLRKLWSYMRRLGFTFKGRLSCGVSRSGFSVVYHVSCLLKPCRLWRGSPKSRDPALQEMRDAMQKRSPPEDDSQRTLVMGEVDSDEHAYGPPSDAESSSTDISARRVWNEKHLRVC